LLCLLTDCHGIVLGCPGCGVPTVVLPTILWCYDALVSPRFRDLYPSPRCLYVLEPLPTLFWARIPRAMFFFILRDGDLFVFSLSFHLWLLPFPPFTKWWFHFDPAFGDRALPLPLIPRIDDVLGQILLGYQFSRSFDVLSLSKLLGLF